MEEEAPIPLLHITNQEDDSVVMGVVDVGDDDHPEGSPPPNRGSESLLGYSQKHDHHHHHPHHLLSPSERRVSVEAEEDLVDNARNFTRKLGEAVRARKQNMNPNNIFLKKKQSMASLTNSNQNNNMSHSNLSAATQQTDEIHEFDDSFEITLEDLRALKTFFDEADEDGGGSLNMSEFVKAFKPVVGDLISDASLRQWFDRIDVNCSGGLDWDEFSSFLLLSSSTEGSDETAKSRYVKWTPSGKQAEAGGSNQPPAPPKVSKGEGGGLGEMATRVLAHPKLSRYYTTCRDGNIRCWNSTSKEFEGFLYGGSGWITDAQFYLNSNRMVFSTIDRFIGICDCTTNRLISAFSGASEFKHEEAQDHTKQVYGGGNATADGDYGATTSNQTAAGASDEKNFVRYRALSKLTETPMSLHMLEERDSFGAATQRLILGLENGAIQIYPMSFPVAVNFVNPLSVHQIHNGAVSVLRTAKFMDGLITASWDQTIQVYSLEYERVIRRLGGKRRWHHMPIKGLEVCTEHRIAASCAADRVVYVWNPFMERKPIFALEGHNAPMVNVAFNSSQHQIVTMSSDKVVKIWDVRTFRCMQTIQDKESYHPEDTLSAMTYDERRSTIVAANKTVVAFPLQIMLSPFPQEPQYYGHRDPLVGALFNDTFSQVITADTTKVQVWDSNTGQRTCTFTLTDNVFPEFRISHIAFDISGRRILIGSNQRLIRVMNYANGQLLKELSLPAPSAGKLSTHYDPIDDGDEVSGLLYTIALGHPRIVAAVGSRILTWVESVHNFVELAETSTELTINPDEMKQRGQMDPDVMPLTNKARIASMCQAKGKQIALGTHLGVIILFSLATWERVTVLSKYRGGVMIEAVHYHEPLDYLIASSSEGFVRIFALQRRMEVMCISHSRPGCTTALHSLSVTPNFTTMFVGDDIGQVHVWDVSAIRSASQWSSRHKSINLSLHSLQNSAATTATTTTNDITFLRTISCHNGAAIRSVCVLPLRKKSHFILTSASDCQARVYTIAEGTFVAYVGQRTRWHLSNEAMWIRNVEAAPQRPPSTEYLAPKDSPGMAVLSAEEILDQVTTLPDGTHTMKLPSPPQQRLQQQHAGVALPALTPHAPSSHAQHHKRPASTLKREAAVLPLLPHPPPSATTKLHHTKKQQ
eukprot:PhM_4_TR2799/c0_g1_i1/m.22136